MSTNTQETQEPQQPQETQEEIKSVQQEAESGFPRWVRDGDGLLAHVNYHRNADGSIDWRKMIKPEYLVVNKKKFEQKKQQVPETIEGLKDEDLLILLGGIRDLARLRGYTKVRHEPIYTNGFVGVKTTIRWIPNFETGGQEVEFDSLADAHERNTEGFAKFYLSAIAENRGFVRAVRNFLGIKIVGQDEVGAPQEEPATNSQGESHKFLEGILNRNKIKFEAFKNRMIERGVPNADTWESVSDIESSQVYELVEIVNRILEERKAKAKS